MENETPQNITPFDALVQDRQLEMLKAAIPYVNSSNQRTMAFLVKFMELQRTVTLFSSKEASIQMCSLPEEEEELPLQMLSTVRDYCTEKEQETVDMLINFMQMFSAYGTLFT